MKPVVLSFTPVASKVYTIEEPGAAILVRQGGWPGLRIFFDSQLIEESRGERSMEVFDGNLVVRDFQRAYVIYPAFVDTVPVSLELEIFKCAPLVCEPMQDPCTRVRYLAQSAPGVPVIVNSETSFAIYTHAVAVDERAPDTKRWYRRAERWLGGAVSCRGPFTLTIWQKVNQTIRAVMLRLDVTDVDPDGNCSLSLDAPFANRTMVTAGVGAPGSIPFPRTGFSIEVFNGDVANVECNYLVYAFDR